MQAASTHPRMVHKSRIKSVAVASSRSTHRSRKDDPLFKLRRVLRVGKERRDEQTVAKIFDGLHNPDTDDDVGSAWVAVDGAAQDVCRPPTATPPTAAW